MKEKIKNYLEKIENEKNIKILWACETGSRAWGFPSPDSDYDVRLIYVHKPDWYLNLVEQKDSIELMLDNRDVDISGWDLRKSLRLLWKSNPPLLERIQSPIIYKENEPFINEMCDIAQHCYSKIATIHHYLNMAKKCFNAVKNTEKYKLKKLFYALRTATACQWILEKEGMPPIQFLTMLDGLSIEKEIKDRILELIELKLNVGESYLHDGEILIFQFIDNCIAQAEATAGSLPPSKAKMSVLNQFFIKTLKHNGY